MLDNGESQKEAIRPNLRRMEERFGIPAIRADLGRLGITNLIGLLGHQRLTRNGLRLINASGPINTVGHQRLEYEAPRSFLEGEDSFFLEQFDPLVQGRRPPQDILLDHYLAYRSRRGEPRLESWRMPPTISTPSVATARWSPPNSDERLRAPLARRARL